MRKPHWSNELQIAGDIETYIQNVVLILENGGEYKESIDVDEEGNMIFGIKRPWCFFAAYKKGEKINNDHIDMLTEYLYEDGELNDCLPHSEDYFENIVSVAVVRLAKKLFTNKTKVL